MKWSLVEASFFVKKVAGKKKYRGQLLLRRAFP